MNQFLKPIMTLLLCVAMLANRAAAEDHGDKKPPEKSSAAEKTDDKSKQSKASDEGTKTIAWLSSLSDGYRRALADRKPMLILVRAKWSESCRKMTKDLETAAVQEELARWTLVSLDLELQSSDAAELSISDVPALRIRTPDGQQAAEHNGYLAPDKLVEWLQKNFDSATVSADEVLLESGEPSLAAVPKLIQQFQQKNPALREAAIRRLASSPNVARPAVIKAFCEGSLTSRLASAEVLEQWNAPMEGMDPWRPESFTAERLARLEKWKDEKIAEEAPPKELAAEQLASARRQIERMLVADESEAGAIRHRLARLGSALLPEVYARLKDAATDQNRRRLLTLRYRLVAGDALVLRWQGGLERLANDDPRQRQKAAEELAKQASGEDQPLLLELFADTDPLVREISLRGLQHIGGSQASAALVKLLADPEPNVRAAVLKQLEESPNSAMTPAVVKYLKEEKDPDLIVHGIRFLQVTKGDEATRCLMSLLKHESWQVRSEAASGIGKLSEGHGYSPPTPSSDGSVDPSTQLQVDAYVALMDLLDDSDGFVVAKAVEGLAHADMAVAVEPLANAAVKHPDLASSVLKILSEGSNMRAKAMPILRKYCTHEDPRLRAAAIAALCRSPSDDVEDEVFAALGDAKSEVRIAAASALLCLLDSVRQSAVNQAEQTTASSSGYVAEVRQITVETDDIVLPTDVPHQDLLSKAAQLLGGTPPPALPGEPVTPALPPKPKPARVVYVVEKPKEDKTKKPDDKKPDDKKPEEEKHWWDQWLEECYAGQHRPKWTTRMIGPLEKMLAAGDPKERIAAAAVLVPLGKRDAALPVLTETLRKNPELLGTAGEVLPWLAWEQRMKTVQQFRELASNEEAISQLLDAFSQAPDHRAAEPLWAMLAEKDVTESHAHALQYALMKIYFGNRMYSSNQPPAVRREVVQAAKPRTETGSDLQRMAALSLLVAAAPDEAAEIAAKLAEDSTLSESLRAFAFHVQLLKQSNKDARNAALAVMKGDDVPRKRIAVKYLVQGSRALFAMSNGFYMSYSYSGTSISRNNTPIIPKPPEGVKAEYVRPLLTDPDFEVAAGAGYLLSVLGEPDGIEPLLKYWRRQQKSDTESSKLVYQAIAVLDDPKHIPVLREIFAKLDKSELYEFYWTIRIMSGPEILKFRKQVRDVMMEPDSGPESSPIEIE